MKRFLIIIGAILLGLAARGQSVTYTCRYWFDMNYAQAVTTTFGESGWEAEIDVGSLTEGIHSLHLHVMDTSMKWSAPQSYMFMKIRETPSADLTYHYWFDQDFENQQSDVLGTGHFLLDVTDLEDGIHTLNVMLQGSTLTATQSYLFMKIAVEDPLTELQYHCWFDQDYENVQTGLLGNGLFELEVGDLSNGLHTVNVQLDNGRRTAPLCYLFYKIPFGGHGIAKWEYWLNGNAANRHTVVINPVVDTLDIISLLPVETWPVRSSCFHFHPNGEEPYLNAKNEITLRFCSADGHVLDKLSFYIDEQVQQNITAEVFERNTTETFTAPRNNQIQWFKVEANIGDSLAFVADKACTMQLFAPSGEEVYAATASEAMELGGCHVWEDGMYYLAVHDVTGSGETISVTYQYVHKYAVLAHDVHQVGNGGNSTITFQGNGFNSLLDVYLVNDQNDTIRKVDIGHESNTATSVIFNFFEANLGMYVAVFQFYDETIRVNDALEVQEPVDIVLTSTVSYPSRFLRNAASTYTYTITNHGNMTAYNVPIAFHVYTPDSTSLTRVDIGGYDVKSYIVQLLGNHFTDSLENVIDQERLISGDLFGFLEDANTDYIPDAPDLHYIFITPTLRPYSTKTFTIAVESTDTVSVYMWHLEEWENEDSTRNLSRKGNPVTDLLCKLVFKRTYDCYHENYVNHSSGTGSYKPCNNKPQPPRFCPPYPGGPTYPVNSFDPNDIHGYLSESSSHYMRQEIQNVQYEIEFENDTTLATAAAHTIIVRDTLDATKFDLNSLAARSVTIGDKRLELNGEQIFARTLDMRPELYVIAQIEQDYDPTTGIVEWTIQSLDPMTMEPTDDPNQGVLPVNYFGNGVGFIDYSINLKQAFTDGTIISNRAGIIFDQNDVILTPTWTNVVDAVTPTSYIEEVTPMADSLNFDFVSQDNRSGVWYRSLYYRNASTEQEWQVRKAQIFEDSFVMHLEDLLTTEYLVIAVDSAGNREDKEMVAEYIYTASGLHFVTEGNWSNDSNWEDCTMPGINDVVFIDAPCQLDQDAEVVALAINNCHTLTVQSGKTLTVNGLLSNTSAEGLVIKDGAQLINASGNVAATMEKDIIAYSNSNPDAWYTIASPMNEMPIEGSSFATPEFDLYRFNESNLTNEEWENYKGGLADFDTFENGRGYLFANSNAFSPAFTGILNASAVSCPLSYTERPNDPLSGFNLIGNPFPHDIYKGVGAAIDNANLASGYYTLTNEGTWQVHTYEDAIHPGQGVLVKATAPTVLTIAKSTAVATSETGEAKRETSPLSISVKGENGQDQAFVYFGRGNSMEKMGGFVAQEPSLWVRDNSKDYAIAHVEKADETLELCFSSKQPGDFSLTVDRNEMEFEYLQLADHVTGLTVDLLKQPSYDFHTTGQEPNARFSIRFKVAE